MFLYHALPGVIRAWNVEARGKVPPKKGQGRGMMIFWCSSN